MIKVAEAKKLISQFNRIPRSRRMDLLEQVEEEKRIQGEWIGNARYTASMIGIPNIIERIRKEGLSVENVKIWIPDTESCARDRKEYVWYAYHFAKSLLHDHDIIFNSEGDHKESLSKRLQISNRTATWNRVERILPTVRFVYLNLGENAAIQLLQSAGLRKDLAKRNAKSIGKELGPYTGMYSNISRSELEFQIGLDLIEAGIVARRHAPYRELCPGDDSVYLMKADFATHIDGGKYEIWEVTIPDFCSLQEIEDFEYGSYIHDKDYEKRLDKKEIAALKAGHTFRRVSSNSDIEQIINDLKNIAIIPESVLKTKTITTPVIGKTKPKPSIGDKRQAHFVEGDEYQYRAIVNRSKK